jgi:hypothetical protein
MTTKEGWEIVGGLSAPSKMPCHSHSIPASACKVGQKLALVAGSVCAGCYAMRGNYRFGNVKTAQARRLESLQNPLWIDAWPERPDPNLSLKQHFWPVNP